MVVPLTGPGGQALSHRNFEDVLGQHSVAILTSPEGRRRQEQPLLPGYRQHRVLILTNPGGPTLARIDIQQVFRLWSCEPHRPRRTSTGGDRGDLWGSTAPLRHATCEFRSGCVAPKVDVITVHVVVVAYIAL